MQILRARGDDDPLTREHGRDQISERLTGARPRLDEQLASVSKDFSHGHRHLLLRTPILEGGERRRRPQWTIFSEKLPHMVDVQPIEVALW